MPKIAIFFTCILFQMSSLKKKEAGIEVRTRLKVTAVCTHYWDQKEHKEDQKKTTQIRFVWPVTPDQRHTGSKQDIIPEIIHPTLIKTKHVRG